MLKRVKAHQKVLLTMRVNIALGKKIPANSFRNFAMIAWGRCTDPNVYQPMEFNVTRSTEFLSALKKKAAEPSVTLFHLFLKAMAMTIEHYPHLNRVLMRSSLYQRQHIELFVVSAKVVDNYMDKYDLGGFKLVSPQSIALKDFPGKLQSLEQESEKFTDDKRYAFNYSLLQKMPLSLSKLCSRIFDVIAYTFNINPDKIFGFAQDQFGTMWVSNVGSLGLPSACVPHYPLSRCGLGVSVGMAKKKPVVIDNTVCIQEILDVTFSIDHRLFDGSHLSQPLNYLQQLLEEPEKLL